LDQVIGVPLNESSVVAIKIFVLMHPPYPPVPLVAEPRSPLQSSALFAI
jgi:hypothetical protein